MMRVSFELAETLAAIVDEGTLDAAARRLHVTPSAVSQRIKTLEEQLGRVVLVRSKPARLTKAGTAVVRMARQIALLEHDTLAELGDDSSEGSRTSVPLAVNADSLATWFLEPLARLSLRHPVVFELHRGGMPATAGELPNERGHRCERELGVLPARPDGWILDEIAVAVLASDNPEAVVLDLMKPERSRRGTRGGHGQARRYESRRQGTHQRHAG